MKRMNKDEWLRECPYHFLIVNSLDIDAAIEWCLDSLEPREWFVVENSSIFDPSTMERTSEMLFAFRHKKHAMIFKLRWWKI
jgi:hypothetical protein